ncbi:alpha/beta hydrolase [Nakamurella flavida]|uniref:Alpha/beta hydrolase n=1 Tax=Nakamurella flavida TaxID=363630 RepID=A0A938YCU6_9ACTN|nr:alpha/beta hydrolase [Nakamurella flavida]MBM9475310.1 alpha/beta hydrolase [Nakamurella flavida]MDP9776884.1 acetyl esterase [Nakamurella flavida]
MSEENQSSQPSPRRRPPRRPVRPVFWVLAQVGSRVRVKAPAALRPGPAAPPPETIRIPTRHGALRALVHRPAGAGRATPVVVHLHGGGFVNRYPEQDSHIAGHLVTELGVTVVLPDYDTAPRVRYPVAEEEVFDVVRWVQQADGWDGARLLLSGVSAGAKLAVNACQHLRDTGGPGALGVGLFVPVLDVTRTDRTSVIPRPAIGPFVQRFVGWSYFPEVARQREPLASPCRDPHLARAMPPTVILTGEQDTLAPEGAELARTLRAGGVHVVHREYPGVDHDFMATARVDTARAALAELAAFFAARLDAATG